MASADQRTTTGGLSGTQNSSQGPQISESASVPLMRKSLRNEYQIQTAQKQDENKTGNTKVFPNAQWTQALSALAQSTMFKLQFHYHTISPLIATPRPKAEASASFKILVKLKLVLVWQRANNTSKNLTHQADATNM